MSVIPSQAASAGENPTGGSSTEAVASLRGAPVSVDSRKAVRVLVVLGLVTLGVLAIVFFIGGAHRNAQVTRLKQHGVPVVMTVTDCIGVASGSGSTPASFTCRGNFVLSGHRYNEIIGGTTALFPSGAEIKAVTVPGDPALIATASSVARERSSSSVYIVPIVLTVLFVVSLLAVVIRLRRPSTR